MSYILDALNKADKERDKELKRHETSHVNNAAQAEPTQASHLPKLMLLFAVLIAGLWFALNAKSPATPHHDHNILSPAQPKIQKVYLPPQTIKTDSIITKTEVVEVEGIAATQQPQNIPNIMDLDPNIRTNLPNIRISAHIYSDNTQKRMVIINDKLLHEGDYISERLILNQIEANSIELAYDGVPFTMRVKDAWPPY